MRDAMPAIPEGMSCEEDGLTSTVVIPQFWYRAQNPSSLEIKKVQKKHKISLAGSGLEKTYTEKYEKGRILSFFPYSGPDGFLSSIPGPESQLNTAKRPIQQSKNACKLADQHTRKTAREMVNQIVSFGRPENHTNQGRLCQKLWTSMPKSLFSCGPNAGEKLFKG